MTKADVVRERHVWVAVTAVLATSLAWLAIVSLALVAGAWADHFPGALVVLRALGHAAVAVGRLGGPTALAALAGAASLLTAMLRTGRQAERRARHA